MSKSRFKARALEFFRQVERTGKPLVITDRGTPVLELVPYRGGDPADGIIVATALGLGATLITADRRLHRYRRVKTAWG